MNFPAPAGADAPVVEVAAAVEGEDRLVGRWTVRQCAWFAGAAGGALAAATSWPNPVAVGVAGAAGAVALGAALVRPGGRAVESWWAPLLGYVHRAQTSSRRAAPRARHRAHRVRIGSRRRLAGLLLVATVAAAGLLGTGGLRLTHRTRPSPGTPALRSPALDPGTPNPGAELARTLAALLAQLAAAHGQ